MSVLGVDIGSTRVHVAIAHEGTALPVRAPDGLAHIPSVVACTGGRTLVGAPARTHFLSSPAEVLFDPAGYLGAGQVSIGQGQYDPEDLVARVLEQMVAAGQAAAHGPIDGVALSRPAWAEPEVRRALADAAQRASVNLVRTEAATTLAAVARHAEQGPKGFAMFVDAGGGKVEAAVLSLEVGLVRALGRSANATMGASWLDERLVEILARQVAPHQEDRLLDDRVCRELLREECEVVRIQLGSESTVTVLLPFLSPALGVKEPPVWRLDRSSLEALAQPLVDAIHMACQEALEHASLPADQIGEIFLSGGLAHMPLVQRTVRTCFAKATVGRGDVDSIVARGAALLAAISLGEPGPQVVDDLDERGRDRLPLQETPSISPPISGTPRPRIVSQEIPRASPSATSTPRARIPSQEIPRSSPSAPAMPHPRIPSQEIPRASPPAPSTPRARIPSQEMPRTAPPVPPAPRPRVPSQETTRSASPPASPASAGPSDPATPEPAPRGQEAALSSEGMVRNPRDPAALAAMPLDAALPPTPPLSVPQLLLALGRRRGFSGLLKLQRANQEACVAIVRGGAAGTSLDVEQLRRSFEWPEGTYRISDDAPPTRLLAMRQPMVGVVTHGLRSYLRTMEIQQVLAVLEPHLALAPRVRPGRAALVPLFGLSPRELRFVEHVLDGATTGEEILRRGGIGRETAIHLLFVLQLFGALDWCQVECRPGETPADRLRQRAHKLEKADHFEVLGVHWSVARAELDRALLRIEEEMRPGGPASQLDAQAAKQILARARLAHQSVATREARHAYLLELHPDLDFEAIESIAENQNEWYAWRGAREATEESARLRNELLELSRLQHNTPKDPR